MISRIFLVVLFCISGLFVNAQILNEGIQNVDASTLVTTSDFAVFSQTNRSASIAQSSNGIFIRQIGDENVARLTTASDNDGLARIDLLQRGDNNYADITDASQEFYKNVIQNGDGNRVLDYSLPTNLTTNFQLLQDGNNLYLEKVGTNSLTENMQVNMTGSARTVIIRSF